MRIGHPDCSERIPWKNAREKFYCLLIQVYSRFSIESCLVKLANVWNYCKEMKRIEITSILWRSYSPVNSEHHKTSSLAPELKVFLQRPERKREESWDRKPKFIIEHDLLFLTPKPESFLQSPKRKYRGNRLARTEHINMTRPDA